MSTILIALTGFERRRLAGAVGAQEAQDLAGMQLEADAVEHLPAPVALAQGIDVKNGAAVHSAPCFGGQTLKVWKAGWNVPETGGFLTIPNRAAILCALPEKGILPE